MWTIDSNSKHVVYLQNQRFKTENEKSISKSESAISNVDATVKRNESPLKLLVSMIEVIAWGLRS